MDTLIKLFFLALCVAATGCTTIIHTGELKVGGGATFATNKTRPVCSFSQYNSQGGGNKYQSQSQTCNESYDLGDLRCTRTWTQSSSADGKNSNSSYASSQPYCVAKPPAPVQPKAAPEVPPTKRPTSGLSA